MRQDLTYDLWCIGGLGQGLNDSDLEVHVTFLAIVPINYNTLIDDRDRQLAHIPSGCRDKRVQFHVRN